MKRQRCRCCCRLGYLVVAPCCTVLSCTVLSAKSALTPFGGGLQKLLHMFYPKAGCHILAGMERARRAHVCLSAS